MILMYKNEKVAKIQILGDIIYNYLEIYNRELLPLGTNSKTKLNEPALLRHR